MQFPVEIHIGSVSIPLHTIAETLGIFIGFRYYIYLKRKNGDLINSPNRLWILIGAMLGAVLGSRLLGGVENPKALMQSGNFLVYFYQNKTVVGGFLGGLWGVELTKKIIHEQQSSGDLFTYPMILALIIGRIGCFSMGVHEATYGSQTSLPWGMNLGDGLNRHPVCLYEIIFLIILWVTILQIEKKYVLTNGSRFKLFMIAYLSFRFLLDFIKPHYTFSFGLSTIQITCLAGLLYYYRYLIHSKILTGSNNSNNYFFKHGG